MRSVVALARRGCLLLAPLLPLAALLCATGPAQAASATELPPRALVIIIDDMGHSLGRGRAALDLPGKLTYAFLPYTPHAPDLARRAHRLGKEIMLHAPMSNIAGEPLGPSGLTPDLARSHFRAKLTVALRQIPHVQGVNNHMGSELTQYPEQMDWVMEVLREQGLYFVDSRTSPRSVAAASAAAHGIPHLTRHVFLDHERDPEAIAAQFESLLAQVARGGLAVAIGHPYPETIAHLRQALPRLEESGIELIHASEAMGLAPRDSGGTMAAHGH